MLLVITPLRGMFRTVTVYELLGASELDMFKAFQEVNRSLEDDGIRNEVNVALVPVTLEQLGDWMGNNIRPNWFQRVTRRIRYEVRSLVRE